jgi:hypothetical protein
MIYIVSAGVIDRIVVFLNAALETSLRVEVAVLADDMLQFVTVDKFNTLRLEQTFKMRGNNCEMLQRVVYNIDLIYTALQCIRKTGEAARMTFADGNITLELANAADEQDDKAPLQCMPMDAVLSVVPPRPHDGRCMTQTLDLLPPLLELCVFSHALPMRIELSTTYIKYTGTSIFGSYEWLHTFGNGDDMQDDDGDNDDDTVVIVVSAKFNRYLMNLLHGADGYVTTIFDKHSVRYSSEMLNITLYAV